MWHLALPVRAESRYHCMFGVNRDHIVCPCQMTAPRWLAVAPIVHTSGPDETVLV